MALKIKLNNTTKLVEQDIYEMARVGFADTLEISVWTNDSGTIPHIHITNNEPRGKKTSIDACVQLEKSAYFSHGTHTDTLNSSQRRALNDFMHAKPRNGLTATNYEYAVALWNDNNSDTYVAMKRDGNKVIVPDYTNIEPYMPNR